MEREQKYNVCLRLEDIEEYQRINGWTGGENKFAKKLVNSTWLKSQFDFGMKDVHNLWAQVELVDGNYRPDFIVFTKTGIYIFEIKDVRPSSKQLRIDSTPNAWTQCTTYKKAIEDKIPDTVQIYAIVVLSRISSDDQLVGSQIRDDIKTKYGIWIWYQEDLKKRFQTLFYELLIKFPRETIRIDDGLALCAHMKIIPENFVKIEKKCNDKIKLHVLQKNQSEIALSIRFTGDRILYGTAEW